MMIQQTVLPLKVKKSENPIPPQGGLALLGEFVLGTGFLESIDRHLPKPGSGAGYRPSEYIFPLILMLHSGGRSLEDLRNIRDDEGLREILPLGKIPTSDAARDWLRRMGTMGGLDGLFEVERELLKLALDHEEVKEYTLGINAIGIEAEKESAEMTYRGFRGYMPILGILAENGFILADEFRQGNIAPSAGNLKFIKKCISQMPKGKKIRYLWSAGAAYQAKVIHFCQEKGLGFIIETAPEKGVLRAIESVGKRHWKPYGNGYIAHKAYSFKKGRKAFQLIVIRRPYQRNLFAAKDASVQYKVVATNRSESARYIAGVYDQQSHDIERRINELETDFGIARMPCGQFEANAVFFRIGILAFNIFRLFLLKSLDTSWHHLGIRAILRRLYQIGGKTLFHSETVS